MSPSVFARQEEKYLLSYDTADALIRILGTKLQPDGRGNTLITNLYLDTPENLLVRRSIEKPHYKEKLRVRTYGTVHSSKHEAFVELKKKYDGQVYKRRAQMSLAQAQDFIAASYQAHVQDCNSSNSTAHIIQTDCTDYTNPLRNQIVNELAWALAHYATLEPFMNIRYERCAYNYHDARITLDCNLAWAPGSWQKFYVENTESLTNTATDIVGDATSNAMFAADNATCGTVANTAPKAAISNINSNSSSSANNTIAYTELLPKQTCIMEIKALGALPLTLTNALSKLDIFPISFSKVGHAYKASIIAKSAKPTCKTTVRAVSTATVVSTTVMATAATRTTIAAASAINAKKRLHST